MEQQQTTTAYRVYNEETTYCGFSKEHLKVFNSEIKALKEFDERIKELIKHWEDPDTEEELRVYMESIEDFEPSYFGFSEYEDLTDKEKKDIINGKLRYSEL